MPRPFQNIYDDTFQHLRMHDCGTYPFGDGASLIALVSHLAPQSILELGTALGYTACCFAKAAPSALIDTVEMDAAHVDIARSNIEQQGYSDRVRVHQGRFDEILPQLSPNYDILFFDGFAPDAELLGKAQTHLRVGGTLICANLGLADTLARKQLQINILNSPHWNMQPSLENGGTRVAVKCGA